MYLHVLVLQSGRRIHFINKRMNTENYWFLYFLKLSVFTGNYWEGSNPRVCFYVGHVPLQWKKIQPTLSYIKCCEFSVQRSKDIKLSQLTLQKGAFRMYTLFIVSCRKSEHFTTSENLHLTKKKRQQRERKRLDYEK